MGAVAAEWKSSRATGRQDISEVPQDSRPDVLASFSPNTVRFGSEGECGVQKILLLKDGRRATIPCQKTFGLNVAFTFSDVN